MRFREIYDIAVPIHKRKEEKYNFWVSFALRPASILATAPFVGKKVKPITITKVSIVSLVIGFILLGFGVTMSYKLLGWCFFFLWGVLDCVDGNLARCNNMCSPLGDLWDTMGGYAAMVFIYFSTGIAAFYDNNLMVLCEKYWYLIMGGFAAIFSIFPRLVMHKKKSSFVDSKAVKELSDKSEFSLSKIVALNLISPTGFLQVILLACIVFHMLNIFVIFYMCVNLGIMVVSLKSLLGE